VIVFRKFLLKVHLKRPSIDVLDQTNLITVHSRPISWLEERSKETEGKVWASIIRLIMAGLSIYLHQIHQQEETNTTRPELFPKLQ
jgi:hypothetical protein